jgi:hypothetical protein
VKERRKVKERKEWRKVKGGSEGRRKKESEGRKEGK